MGQPEGCAGRKLGLQSTRRAGFRLRAASVALVLCFTAFAADWPMPDGNPERNNWAALEHDLTKRNIQNLKLLYKFQTDNRSDGLNGLTSPVIDGNLITYRGFKEMLLLSGSSDHVYSVDADLNHVIWEDRLKTSDPPKPANNAGCYGGMTAPVIMSGSSATSLNFVSLARRTPLGGRRPHHNPYYPPLAQSLYPLLPTTLDTLNALYTVTSDGMLHILNSSTGEDLLPPARFVPPGANVTSLNLHENVVYATTGGNCDGQSNALYAFNILSPQKTVASFRLPSGRFAGSAATAIGTDGAVYVQCLYQVDPQHKPYEAVVALAPKDLKVKDYFLFGKPIRNAAALGDGITPVVFSYGARDVLLAGGADGRLYLLDSKSLGGATHKLPLFRSEALARTPHKYDGAGWRGAFSTWLDVETATRRFYAPALGGSAGRHASAADSILAFELDGSAQKPYLKPLWTASVPATPAPVVIANGMAFVLSTGQPARTAKKNGKPYSVEEITQMSGPASLQIFDSVNGSRLYSGPGAPVSASLRSGLAVANGRAYFSARDNAVYCFGIPAQQSQLYGQ